MRLALLLVFLVACGDPAPGVDALRVDRVEPVYAPLSGGTLVTLHGAGFAATTRVLVGGRESALVRAVTTSQLDVVVPPGERSGNVEIVVFEDTGSITAPDLFHYSAGPTITGVSPVEVSGVTDGAMITLTGSGFLAEGAGTTAILLDGQLHTNVTIVDDTTLTFTTFGGRIFSRPDLELVNQRGRALRVDAFRYTPGDHPGLLMFSRFGSNFAVFYDPITNGSIPIIGLPTSTRMRTVYRDAQNNYWGIDVSNRIGRLDLETQNLINPVQMFERIPSVMRIGDEVYGLRRNTPVSLGNIDTVTGFVAAVPNTTFRCCGSFGLAYDGTTAWVMQRSSDFQNVTLSKLDVATGVTSDTVVIGAPANLRFEELRVWNGVMYAAGSMLVRIDPQTGVVTQLTEITGDRFTAIEPYE
jgi:IPT/TIG domain